MVTNMVGFKNYLLSFMLLLGYTGLSAQSIIHFQNWEGQQGDGGWISETGGTNQWLRGTDESGISPGNKSAYISSDISTYGYDETVAEETYLYKDIDFPTDATYDMVVTFDWKCVGEFDTNFIYDYMKVYLVDDGLANPTISNIAAYSGFVYELNSDNPFYNQSTFTTFSETLPMSVEGRTDLRLVFAWINDGNTTDGDPAAVDNIIVSVGPPPSTLSGEYLVGQASGAYFETLTDATYFLNSYGVSGDVTFKLTDVEYNDGTEFFPIVIDNFNSNPTSNAYNFTLKPNTGVATNIIGTVSGGFYANGSYNGIVTINGADNVTIEGSNDGSGSRDMKITNLSTAYSRAIFVGSDNPAYNDNINIQNCIIQAAYSTSTSTSVYASSMGIYVGDNDYGGNGGFSNLTLDNNEFFKCDYGIYAIGGSAGSVNGSINSISNNDMDQDGTNDIANLGIYAQGVNGGVIENNIIGNFDGSENERDYGIYLGSGASNLTIAKNEIFNIAYTGSGGYSGTGIRITSSTSNSGNIVRNNVIYGMSGDGEDITTYYSYNPFAILLTGNQSGVDIYNNSIYLSGNTLNFNANALSVGVGLATGSSADIRNNIIVNNLGRSGTTGIGAAAIFAQSSNAQFENINYNNYYVNASGSGANYIGRIGTTNYASLSAWKTASGNDASSISADPGYTSSTDLTPDITSSNSWYVNGTGVQLSSVADDFNGAGRSVSVANGAPDLGAYEFTPSSTPVSAVSSGSHAKGGTEIFTVAGRTIAEITWGNTGTIPSVDVKYYSGANPLNPTPATAQFFNSYVDITATGGTNFTYDLTLHYDEALLGTLSAESDLRLSKDDGTGWISFADQTANVASNSVTVSGLDGFSYFTGSDIDNVLLPVELITFEGIALDKSIGLKWITASELNNDHFIVERSADGHSWRTIGRVEGHGTTDSMLNYATNDDSPLLGRNFYRLKQVDFDGAFDYSKVIRVDYTVDNGIQVTSLYPNPAREQINLKFNSNSELPVSFKIINTAGIVVHSSSDVALAGSNSYQFDLSGLKRGLYILIARSQDGTMQWKFEKE